MPIQRYRRIEDVPPPDARDPNDQQTMSQAAEFFANPPLKLPPLFAPGVYKYGSVEEANAAKEAAVIERARSMRRM